MAINPALSLGIKQPEIEGPVEAFKSTMALKSMLDTQAMNKQMMATRQQEMQLREQQIEENKVKAEDLRKAQRGMEVYSNAVKNNTKAVPGQGFVHDWDGIANEVEQFGFPAIADKVRTNQAELDTKTQSNLKTHLENHKTQLSTVESLFSDVPKEEDDAKGAVKYAAAQQRAAAMNLPPEATQGMPAQYGPEAKDWIKQNHDMVTSAQEKLNEVNASLAQKKAAVEIPEARAKLYKESKDNESREIDSYGPDLFNQKKADDKDFATRWPGDYEASKKAAKEWRQSITRPTAALLKLSDWQAAWDDPEKVKTLGLDPTKFSRDAAGYEKWQQAQQAEKIITEQKALSPKGPMEEVAPKAAPHVMAEQTKAYNEYNAASEGADLMKTFVDGARKGNMVAYRYLPTEGAMEFNVGAGIKRVNMAEIKSYGGAGDVWQRFQGWLGANVTGKSIPDSILSDVESIHKDVAAAAGKKYNRAVDNLNKNYGSKFERQAESGAEGKGPSVEIGGRSFRKGDTVPTDKGDLVIDDINEKGQVRWRK